MCRQRPAGLIRGSSPIGLVPLGDRFYSHQFNHKSPHSPNRMARLAAPATLFPLKYGGCRRTR